MRILGIETSCDETAAAVVEDGNKLLSNVVVSSAKEQQAYGGVVPEIAARSHIESINPVIEKALQDAFSVASSKQQAASRHKKSGVSDLWENVDAIAVSYGPGLGGSLLVGVLTARTLAIIHKKPLYAINHVEAHGYASFITSTSAKLSRDYNTSLKQPAFPLLALIVSGGHTQLVLFEDHLQYKVLGRTADDAVGEAFDKVAKMLGLPYPGGPSVEKLAKQGNPDKFKFPKAKLAGKFSFSYSGLKTAVLRAAQEVIGEDYTFPSHKLKQRLTSAQKADIAASFTNAAIEALTDKTVTAYEEFAPASVVVAGGVSASPELRRQMTARLPIKPYFPDIKLCTDNAAMIAALGYYQAKYGSLADAKRLDIQPNLSM